MNPAPVAEAEKGCGTQLEAQAGFSLSSGDFVVTGLLCEASPTRYALEHFAPGARRGTLYLAGSTVADALPYLATFSPGAGIEELKVSADVDPIQRIAVSSDGSVWVKAPVRDKRIDFDDDGLWRRSPRGEWQRITIEPRVPIKPRLEHQTADASALSP